MKLFAGLERIVKTEQPLAAYTWLRIGGPAQYFIEPTDADQLADVLRRCRENEVPVYVLGGGANLVVGDSGVRGAVVRLCGDQFTRASFNRQGLTAGGGANLSRLVLRSVRKALSGMECLTGIPGTVGGAVKMNAGGAFGDIGSIIQAVHLMDVDGVTHTRLRGDLHFGYRTSNVTSRVILGADFQLVEDDPHRVLQQVKQIWIYKKNTQPLSGRNAGCIFKNPRQLSAGALIDKGGLKGRRIGGAHVSDKHANFILADSGTRATDVLKLIDVIRETVYKRFEVYLEPEIEVW